MGAAEWTQRVSFVPSTPLNFLGRFLIKKNLRAPPLFSLREDNPPFSLA